MPLNAVGWSRQADEKLVELVEPHLHLYNVQDPSRKNILTRESTWYEIALAIGKPVEECKKRWRGIRDGYVRSKRLGAVHKTKVGIFEKLTFLDRYLMENGDETEEPAPTNTSIEAMKMESDEQQVITDNQEYYEITVVETPMQSFTKTPEVNNTQPKLVRILPKGGSMEESNIKKLRKPIGRRKAIPIPQANPPIKILPKPISQITEPKIMRFLEDSRATESRSQVIDNLIERMLNENTNEIDVFFRSMAATVKKLQPNLIPKVKMEVCNVVAKYEMQSFERNGK